MYSPPRSPRSPRYRDYRGATQAQLQMAQNPFSNIVTNLGQGLNDAAETVTQSVGSLFSNTTTGATQAVESIGKATGQSISNLGNTVAGTISPRNYRNYRHSSPPTRGFVGGPLPYNQSQDWSVSRPDNQYLGLGTGGYGGQAGGSGGYGGQIALTSLYPPQRIGSVQDPRLVAQGTRQALPIGELRSGMYGTRQSGPALRRDPTGSPLGTYDTGRISSTGLRNRAGSSGTQYSDRYGNGTYATTQ